MKCKRSAANAVKVVKSERTMASSDMAIQMLAPRLTVLKRHFDPGSSNRLPLFEVLDSKFSTIWGFRYQMFLVQMLLCWWKTWIQSMLRRWHSMETKHFDFQSTSEAEEYLQFLFQLWNQSESNKFVFFNSVVRSAERGNVINIFLKPQNRTGTKVST